MRIMTLQKATDMVHRADPKTDFNLSMLRRMCENKLVRSGKRGNRQVLDFDEMVCSLYAIFDLSQDNVPTSPPMIRTIEHALEEKRNDFSMMGLGEKRIRELIRDGTIPSLPIGNRNYIALESFEPPFINRWLKVWEDESIPQNEEMSYVDKCLLSLIQGGSSEPVRKK